MEFKCKECNLWKYEGVEDLCGPCWSDLTSEIEAINEEAWEIERWPGPTFRPSTSQEEANESWREFRNEQQYAWEDLQKKVDLIKRSLSQKDIENCLVEEGVWIGSARINWL